MIYSMTGFASDIIILNQDENKIKLTISIKSLNSKYFDVTSKLPYILSQYENELIKLIKSKLYRGNISLIIHLDDHNAFKTSIQPSLETIKAYVKAAQIIQKELNLSGNLTINEFIRLPNIFILEDKGINDASKNIIFASIQKILDQVNSERLKEGNELKKDLEQRLEIMQKRIEAINQFFSNNVEQEKEKLSKKIQEIKELQPEQSHDSYIQMLQLNLEKMDIHEEVSRFKSHINNIQKILNAPNIEKGKQLDFTLQELFRETNTIMAKSSTAEIIENAIGIKVEIEKSREQVQNIV